MFLYLPVFFVILSEGLPGRCKLYKIQVCGSHWVEARLVDPDRNLGKPNVKPMI